MEPTYALPEFHPHFDVYAVLVLLAGGFWWAERRMRPLVAPEAPGATRRQWISWYSGVAMIWVSAGWPVHDLAEQTLFSVHMFEHILIGYVVPPLLLIGMPRWMADRTLGHPRVAPVMRAVSHPVTAFFAFNGALIGVHWPQAVTWQNTSEVTHLLLHGVLFVTGVLLWLRVLSPTPEIPRLSRPLQMFYLFATTILPTVPASFLTFSDSVLYPVYGDAALAWGLTPVEDQTIAGLVMKIGGGLYLLGVIAAIWIRWIGEEREWDRIERRLVETGPPPG